MAFIPSSVTIVPLLLQVGFVGQGSNNVPKMREQKALIFQESHLSFFLEEKVKTQIDSPLKFQRQR